MAMRAHTAEQSFNGGVTYKWITGLLIAAVASAYYAGTAIATNRTRITACEAQMERIASQVDEIHRLLLERLPRPAAVIDAIVDEGP